MPALNLVLLEEDHRELQQAMLRLCRASESKAVFLIDKNGQQLMAAGDYSNIDTISLATLTAGNVAATDSLAQLLGEKGFTILFHEGARDNIHISIVGKRLILVVIFDERSSLGLVRLRVRKASADIERVLNEMETKAQEVGAVETVSPFAEITDDDIDALFSE